MTTYDKMCNSGFSNLVFIALLFSFGMKTKVYLALFEIISTMKKLVLFNKLQKYYSVTYGKYQFILASRK